MEESERILRRKTSVPLTVGDLSVVNEGKRRRQRKDPQTEEQNLTVGDLTEKKIPQPSTTESQETLKQQQRTQRKKAEEAAAIKERVFSAELEREAVSNDASLKRKLQIEEENKQLALTRELELQDKQRAFRNQNPPPRPRHVLDPAGTLYEA